MLLAQLEWGQFVSADRDLAYHRAEIARLKEAIASSAPQSRRAGLLRATLQLHEEIVARSHDRVARRA
jgi:lambda repressor-like predicted transcriptional regulator